MKNIAVFFTGQRSENLRLNGIQLNSLNLTVSFVQQQSENREIDAPKAKNLNQIIIVRIASQYS